MDPTSETHPGAWDREAVLGAGLRDLARHDVRHHGDRSNLFIDAFSEFGAAFPAMAPLGIGSLCPRAFLATGAVTNPTLALCVLENAFETPIQRQRLVCDPWATIESAWIPASDGWVLCEATHVFADATRLLSEFRFSNPGNTRVRLAPLWRGSPVPEHELYMLPYFHGAQPLKRTPAASVKGETVRAGLVQANEGDCLPSAVAVVTALKGTQRALALPRLTERGYAFLPDTPLDLAPEAIAVFRFSTTLEIDQPRSASVASNSPAFDDRPISEWTRAAKDRFGLEIGLANPPPVPFPAQRLRTWRARHALLRSGMEARSGEFAGNVASLCTPDNSDFSCVFFWDSLFTSVAASRFNKRLAQGAIRTAFVRQDERDGSSPERKFNHGVRARMAQQAPQSPVASWAVCEYLRCNPDEEFLRELYPRLVRNHEFWRCHSDADRDGLSEYTWSGQVCDNSPLWDPYASIDPRSGCGWLPPVASVALNCFLHKDALHLADLAGQMGLADDVRRHRERAAQLERDLLAICLVPSENRLWDYDHHTRRHRRVKTFYLFWPLYAGIQLPEATRKSLIEDVLLDPSQFFGAVPFPSTAYDEPTYDPKGYWRGRSWPHITYWLLETLVAHGYTEAAEEAARRTLEAFGRSQGFPENLASAPELFEAQGFTDYNWGAAAFHLIATKAYLHPLRTFY
jgi:hypothetical protein